MKAKKNVIKAWSKNKKMPLKEHIISVKTQAFDKQKWKWWKASMRCEWNENKDVQFKSTK